MAQRNEPTNPEPTPPSDLAREIHPVDLFPTWDMETPAHVHRTVEQIYNENFRPGVPDGDADADGPEKTAVPQKPADNGGTAKA